MRVRERGKRVRIRSRAGAPRYAPVLEPTGRFSLPAPAPAPARAAGRVRRRARRASPLWAWLWRNAESLAWCAVLSALSLSLWFSPRTQLTRLEAAGAPSEAHPALYALLEAHIESPIPLSDTPRQLERAAQSLDWVQEARWQARGVGRARLQITPRTPFVEIQGANGDRLFADRTGFLFQPPNPSTKPIAGVIRYAQDMARINSGCTVEGEMQAALKILDEIQNHSEVKHPRVRVSRASGIQLFAAVQRGAEPPVAVQIRFGDATALDAQLKTMVRLLNTPLTELRQWEYIDISTPNAEAVKPREAAGGEP